MCWESPELPLAPVLFTLLLLFLELVLERCELELEANGRDHHTADLCRERLVVRRGQPFRLTLHFQDRGYEASVDRLTFSAATGKDPHALHCPSNRHQDRAFLSSPSPEAPPTPKGQWGS